MARLIEREQVVATIGGALYRAQKGKGTAVFVIGEPGLGKTSVLHEARLLAGDFAASSATCFENETSLPFGLLDRIFEDLEGPVTAGRVDSSETTVTLAAPDRGAGGVAGAGGRIVPGGGGGGDAADRRAARYSSLIEWLRHSAPSRLLLCIDDAHWADPDSFTLLSMICRRIDRLPIALVVAMRPWPSATADCARMLAADGYGVVEKLAPLSGEGAVDVLSEALTTQRTSEQVCGAIEACAGNPLLLREVADAWMRGEDVVGPGAAGSLQDRVFLSRFAGTGSTGYELARCASILGTRFPVLVAAVLAQLGRGEVGAALEALIRTGLVREAGDGSCEFVHPLFRQALYDEMSFPLRQSLHARAFDTLLDQGAQAEAAPHAVAGTMLGDSRAVKTLVSTGRAALAAGAPASAAAHLAGALKLAGGNAPLDMHIELAQARLVGGQIDLAIDGLATLLKRNDLADGDRLAILRMLVQAHFGLGDIGAVERLETEAVELAARVDPVAACDILLDSSFVGWLIEGPLSARRKVSRVLDMIASCEISDDRLLATARAADANLSFIEGFPTGNEMLSEVAIAKSARSVLPGTWDAAFGYVNLSKLAEQFDEDAEDYQAMAAAAENEGAVLAFQTYSINYADTLWRIGRIRQAYDLVSRAAELADLVPMLMPFAWVGMAHLSQELGMDEQSSGWAHRLDELLQFIGESAYLRLWLIMFEARDHLRTGHVDEASASALRLAELAEESSIREPCVVPWHTTAIEALVAANRLESASKVIEALEEVNSRLPCHTPKAAAAVGRAMIAWRSGDVEAADQLFEEALLHNAAVPMPLAYAETLIAKGRFLRHTGRLQEARKVLRSALGVVESAGAVRLQRIALQELAVAGGRRSKGSNIGSLTAQEVRVSELAAEGITNKQIAQQLYISAKTVDHHLSRIYSKLGINSRRELMKVWRDHKLI